MPPKKGDEEKLNRALCKPGAKVFYWEPLHAWAIGIVEADDGKNFKVKGHGYSCTKVQDLETVDKCPEEKIWPVREDVLDEDMDDLLQMTVLHDATIQRCLYLRYMKDTCYTNIGAITVALNPWNFKIPKYVDAKMPDYLAEGDRIKNNVPHSWAQAHNTWNEMREESGNQCILISGESGAGKTEAAKIVMKYVGALSCLRGTEGEKDAARKVAFNINQASPILEGFGNAKTVRNDNSSRFGKFMKVQFDAGGFLVGAFTTKYLLEKSRIITANPNERIYHSFYLLTRGCDAGKYNVKEPGCYETTCNAGKCVDIPKVDDGEDYSICVEAMKNCGFNADQIDGTWRMCAGALQLGTVLFKEIDKDTCDFIDKSGIADACASWMTDPAVLEHELMTTTMTTRDGPVVKKLNKAAATDSRDSLVRTTYDNTFSWQVLAINALTDSGTGVNFIGLLDIFGFEDFEYNSFEQLCINLANETLQNHYNTYIFTKDMDECKAEGIDITEVKCPDNMPCLKMLTDKTGIFGKLDDESNMGSGTDAGFLDKVKQDFDGKHPFFGTKRMSKDSFIVHHYAASVNYTVEHWLEKNRDALKPDLKLFMRASGQALIRELLPVPEEQAKKITVGGFFKQQLGEMMALINSTNPHWIRCVKPHPAKKPLMLHGVTCMGQLESSGVLGTVKIRKAGFPVRPTYEKFLARYKCLAAGCPAKGAALGEIQAYCRKIVEAAQIDPMKAQCGKTKMFLKSEASQKLEAERERALKIHIDRLNGYARAKISAWLVRDRRLLWAARHTQYEVREWLKRSAAQRAEREARRQALLEQMRALLGPFEEEREAARAAIEAEEAAAWAEIADAKRAELAGMLGAVLCVVEHGETEGRRPIEEEEQAAWDEIFRVGAAEGSSLLLREIERQEERRRRAIEEAWWQGGEIPPLPPLAGGAGGGRGGAAARGAAGGAAGLGQAVDVTAGVLRPPRQHVSFAAEAEDASAGLPNGLSGLVESYYRQEMELLESAGDESEAVCRGEVAKRELWERRLLYRSFLVDWVDVRLQEEEWYETVWRAEIEDQEDIAWREITQALYREQLELLARPPSLKGTWSEPARRALLEKAQRDSKRALYARWSLLRLEGWEEMVRTHLWERFGLCQGELSRREELERQEGAARGQLELILEPLRADLAEQRQVRRQRAERRDRKLRRLRRLWQQEMDRMEEVRDDYYEQWREREEAGIELLERELEEGLVPFPGTLRSAVGRYQDAQLAGTPLSPQERKWPTPDGREPFAAVARRRRELERFKRWMDSVDAAADRGELPADMPPTSPDTGPRNETLWDYLRRLQAEALLDAEEQRDGLVEAVRRLGTVSPAALEPRHLARVAESPRGAAAPTGRHEVLYDTQWQYPPHAGEPPPPPPPPPQPGGESSGGVATAGDLPAPAAPPQPGARQGFDAAADRFVNNINQALAANSDLLRRDAERRARELAELREMAGTAGLTPPRRPPDPAGLLQHVAADRRVREQVYRGAGPSAPARHAVPEGHAGRRITAWERRISDGGGIDSSRRARYW